MNPLLLSARDRKAKRQLLLDSYPDLADDIETLEDTLDGETDTKELVLWAVRKIDEAERQSALCKAEIDEIRARQSRYNGRVEMWRNLVIEAMTEADIKKAENHRFTVSRTWQKGGVVIHDEDALPREYGTTKWTPSKTAIKDALEGGADIPGASMGNGYPSITIRKS